MEQCAEFQLLGLDKEVKRWNELKGQLGAGSSDSEKSVNRSREDGGVIGVAKGQLTYDPRMVSVDGGCELSQNRQLSFEGIEDDGRELARGGGKLVRVDYERSSRKTAVVGRRRDKRRLGVSSTCP